MGIEFTFANALYALFNASPKICIYPELGGSIALDEQTGESIISEFDEFACIDIHPSEQEILDVLNNYKKEYRSNRYIKDVNMVLLAENNIKVFSEHLEKFSTKEINGKRYFLRGDNSYYYSIYGNCEEATKIELEKLPAITIEKISGYCSFQKDIIEHIIALVLKSIPQISSTFTFQEKILTNESEDKDPRINLGVDPEEIRSFFSFLIQDTSKGKIMSVEDLEYFLSLNFSCFEKVEEKKNISFSLIANKDFRYIIYKFYRKFSGLKKYPRTRWAQLLHNSFPHIFTEKIESTASNFKPDTYTVSKLNDWGINHPF